MAESVRYAMPWALLLMAIVFVVGTILFVVLDPVVDWMLTFATGWHPEADTGLQTTRTFWDYWPLWFGGMLVVFGFAEAIRRSGTGGAIR